MDYFLSLAVPLFENIKIPKIINIKIELTLHRKYIAPSEGLWSG
jgi:hypothetical protein